ncbi:capsular biosynthesis protein [Escherichia coli]
MRNYILRKIISDTSEGKITNKFLCFLLGGRKPSLKFLRDHCDDFIKHNNFITSLNYCDYIIKNYPLNSFGYIQKSNLYLSINNKDASRKILEECKNNTTIKTKTKTKKTVNKNTNSNATKINNEIKRLIHNQEHLLLIKTLLNEWHNLTLEQILILSQTYQKVGQFTNAYKTLIDAQIIYPNDRKILMRLGEILQLDKKTQQAHIYFSAAKLFYPEYGAVKKLSFEIDHDFLDEAHNTLNEILLFPLLSHLKFLPVLNRASPFFKNKRKHFISIRRNVKNLLWAPTGRKGVNPSYQASVAIKCRWLDLAEDIAQRNIGSSQPVSENIIHWLNRVKEYQDGYSSLFDLANYNDENENIRCFLNGDDVELYKVNNSDFKIIEIFIPQVFFSNPIDDKPSFSTIRLFFQNIFSHVTKLKNIIIIPRNQWNWRKCDPLIENAYVISYHTYSSNTKTNLHIQESTLANRCSMDCIGYAGYSSLATNFTLTKDINISNDFLEQYTSAYINNNISKYKQPDNEFNLNCDYVFIPMQVTTDAVATLAYIDCIKLVKIVSEHYFNSPTKVVVKRHPYCNSMDIEMLLTSLEKQGKIIISDASIHKLIHKAKIVITVNSGVGLEALIHNKPVIIAGKSDYSYAVSAIVKNEEELKNTISNTSLLNRNKELRNKFLCYYLSEYSIHYDDKDKIGYRIDSFLNIQ